ncbi:GNAT family N-acetyltransferase [Myroides sp. LJL116]
MQFSLIKFQEEDFELFYSLVSCSKVMLYITKQPSSLKQAKEKFQSMLEQNKSHSYIGNYKILDNFGRFIGHGKIVFYKNDPSMLEVGYVLDPGFWGKGYATAICRALVQKGLKHLPDLPIIALIDPENGASRKVLQKCDFESYLVEESQDFPTEYLRYVPNKSIEADYIRK